MSASGNLTHLLGRLRMIEGRVRRAVAVRQSDDPEPNDPFRGLYLSDDAVGRLLARGASPADGSAIGLDPIDAEALAAVEQVADERETAGEDLRLRRLAAAFGLTALDVEILLVAMAPDLDARFEWLYGYLNDDVSRRRPTTGLALKLCGVPEADARARARFTSGAPLIAGGLVVVDEFERPFLSRSLRVPDRVTAHLLGDDAPDPDLTEVLRAEPATAGQDGAGLAGAIRSGVRLAYLRERTGASGLALSVAAAHNLSAPTVVIDCDRLSHQPDPRGLATVIVREARLTGAVIVAGPADALTPGHDLGSPALSALRTLADAGRGARTASLTVLLTGTSTWDPAWSQTPPYRIDVAAVEEAQRAALWSSLLDGHEPIEPSVPGAINGTDAAAATAQFVLTPDQVARASQVAQMHAAISGAPITATDIRRGARDQNAARLERLARRIDPVVTWDDLVLPAAITTQLHEVALRARQRSRVLDEWQMRPGGGRGRGVTALFAGDSGTGKTMSAEVISTGLGLDLYTVNLATVVDKYVGETEKNLEKIFESAAGVNAVLLFDEADALFGKRSETQTAHDRYANIETAYLLQRMESFDGLAILSTNLRSNLDDAFTRRLDVIVDFPVPDEDLRRSLWEKVLGPKVPRAADLDLEFCARAFELSGGNIRSAAVTATYLAADRGEPVSMTDLISGIHREYRKMGRLTLEAEFGSYLRLVR